MADPIRMLWIGPRLSALERLAIGVLKAPPNAPVMLDCYTAAHEANTSKIAWGETGPMLATNCFVRHGLHVHALPRRCSIPSIGGTRWTW